MRQVVGLDKIEQPAGFESLLDLIATCRIHAEHGDSQRGVMSMKCCSMKAERTLDRLGIRTDPVLDHQTIRGGFMDDGTGSGVGSPRQRLRGANSTKRQENRRKDSRLHRLYEANRRVVRRPREYFYGVTTLEPKAAFAYHLIRRSVTDLRPRGENYNGMCLKPPTHSLRRTKIVSSKS